MTLAFSCCLHGATNPLKRAQSVRLAAVLKHCIGAVAMAAVRLDLDMKLIVYYMMRRVALRAAKAKLEANLGRPPSTELIEAEADAYTSDSGAMTKLIGDLWTSKPPGLQPPVMVQSLTVMLSGGRHTLPCSSLRLDS